MKNRNFNLISSVILFFITISLYSQKTIVMESENGVYTLPCKVNGVLMNFIFDTGASNVTISLTEANFLIKQGLLSKNDFLNNENYKLANGEIIEGSKVILKTIEIEGLFLNNIEATIIHNQDAPLLLGQTAISKLGKVSIDGNILTIDTNSSVIFNEFKTKFQVLKEEVNEMKLSDDEIEISYLIDYGIYNDLNYSIAGIESVKKKNEDEKNRAFIIPFNKINEIEYRHYTVEKNNSEKTILAIKINSKPNEAFYISDEKEEEGKDFVFLLSPNFSGDLIINQLKELIKINQEIVNNKVDDLFNERILDKFNYIKERLVFWEFKNNNFDLNYNIELIKHYNGGFAINGILTDKMEPTTHKFLIPINEIVNMAFKNVEDYEEQPFTIMYLYNDKMNFKYDNKATNIIPFILNSLIKNNDVEEQFSEAFKELVLINDEIIKKKN